MSGPRIACALLAAGESRRLGHAKQLLPWKGTSLVRAVATEIRRSRADLHAVVIGYEGERVRSALNGLAVALLDNPHFKRGITASIRVAVAWAEANRADVLILCACDQPRLTARHIDALVRAFDEESLAVASTYNGVRGIPAAFSAAWFPHLRALEGDRGAGMLLRASDGVQEVVWEDGAFDVDTRLDEARLLAEAERPCASDPSRMRARGPHKS